MTSPDASGSRRTVSLLLGERRSRELQNAAQVLGGDEGDVITCALDVFREIVRRSFLDQVVSFQRDDGTYEIVDYDVFRRIRESTMKEVSFDYEDLKVILGEYAREGGWLKDHQEVEDILLKFRKRELPVEPGQFEEPRFEVRIDGLRIKFRDIPRE